MGYEQALKLVRSKWIDGIVYALSGGARRNGELLQGIPGISQKMLTQTLRLLERHGMVERRSYPVVPPMVEYTITPLGRTLREPLDAMSRWARERTESEHAETSAGSWSEESPC